MKPPTIPTIELSQETGTITNALDLAAWLRCNSTDWSHIEDVARHHQMSRIERLELLALTFGLALERAKWNAVEQELRYQRPILVPKDGSLDNGFEIVKIDPVFNHIAPGVLVPMDYSLPSHEQIEARLNRTPEPLPETIKPKDPADLAPAVFIGTGLFFAIAAGVLAMTGHGLAAGICGVTSLLSLVRASKFPA